MKPYHSHSATRGFTLIELLVVILIIVVLAGLSIMMFQRMRGMADKVGAITSLSQIQLANASYAGDNNGQYVPFVLQDNNGNRIGWWFSVPEFLTYYRGAINKANGQPSLDVPVEMLDPKVVRAKQASWDMIYGSFGINVNGLPSTAGNDAAKNYTTYNVTKPEQSMAFASSTDVSLRYPARFLWDGTEGKTSNSKMAYRHNNKALIVYFDGHVGELSMDDMKQIDKTRGGSKSAFWLPNQN